MEYTVLGTLILIADIYAIYNVLTSRVSGLRKVLWTVGIVVFPVIGFVVWLLTGPRNATIRA